MTDTPTTQATETPPPLLAVPSRIAFATHDGLAIPQDISGDTFERFGHELTPYDPDVLQSFDVVRREGRGPRGFNTGARWIVGPRGHLLEGSASNPVERGRVRSRGLELPPRMCVELGERFTLERSGILWYAFPMPEETKSEPPASVDVVIQTKSEPPAPELPTGKWGWRASELPEGAILVYQPGTWYRSGRGLEFCFAEPPRMVTGRPGYWVGKVLMRDGRVTALIWGPKTRELSWWERFTADHLGRKQVVT
jgi:hypothetical protein